MRQQIRLGYLGAGTWGRSKHLPAISYIREHYSDYFDITISALCERDKDIADEVQREYGIKTVYDNVDSFADDENLDCYAVIIKPNNLPDVLQKLSRRKVPILTEKPPGLTTQDTQNLADNIKTPNVVGFNRCYFPIVQKFKEILDETDDIYYMDCNFYRHERYDSNLFSESRGDTSLPFVVGTGVHAISVIEYLFGNIEQCMTTKIKVKANNTDAWLTDLNFKSGLKGRLKILPCSGSETEWLEVHSQMRSIYLHYTIYSENDYPGRIYVYEKGKLKEIIEGDANLPRIVNEGFVDEYLELFRAVVDGSPTRSNFQSAVNTMRVAELIEKLG
jgi:myo-inositol 2-dehydrogenase / D-chiro-inositol 1-dehydrogenase